ncbi:MAG: AMP-binding protein, partial [Firmicutes bacterium]|nr:AMP-binding protein [Bacillota bacterium]
MAQDKEYTAQISKERKWAEDFVAEIKNSRDSTVKYKDSRPITDIKDMIESSCEKYAENTAFWVKDKKGGEYRPIKYKEALADINGLGTALIAAGFKGRHISVIGENSYKWAVSYLAVVCGTGVVVPLDKELSADELKNIIKQAEVSCVIFDGKYEEIFKTMRAEGDTKLDLLISMNAETSSQEMFAWKDMTESGRNMVISGNKDFINAEINQDEMSVLLFTSGTTGVSKGVMLSHKNIAADLMTAPTVLKVTPDDVFFSLLPLHHTYECTCGFLMPLYKGASIAYCEGLKYIVKNLAEAKPTLFLGVPAVFENLYKKIWQNARKKGKEETLKKAISINKKTKKIGIDIGMKLLGQDHSC